eukprot:gene15889-17489_t
MSQPGFNIDQRPPGPPFGTPPGLPPQNQPQASSQTGSNPYGLRQRARNPYASQGQFFLPPGQPSPRPPMPGGGGSLPLQPQARMPSPLPGATAQISGVPSQFRGAGPPMNGAPPMSGGVPSQFSSMPFQAPQVSTSGSLSWPNSPGEFLAGNKSPASLPPNFQPQKPSPMDAFNPSQTTNGEKEPIKPNAPLSRSSIDSINSAFGRLALDSPGMTSGIPKSSLLQGGQLVEDGTQYLEESDEVSTDDEDSEALLSEEEQSSEDDDNIVQEPRGYRKEETLLAKSTHASLNNAQHRAQVANQHQIKDNLTQHTSHLQSTNQSNDIMNSFANQGPIQLFGSPTDASSATKNVGSNEPQLDYHAQNYERTDSHSSAASTGGGLSRQEPHTSAFHPVLSPKRSKSESSDSKSQADVGSLDRSNDNAFVHPNQDMLTPSSVAQVSHTHMPHTSSSSSWLPSTDLSSGNVVENSFGFDTTESSQMHMSSNFHHTRKDFPHSHSFEPPFGHQNALEKAPLLSPSQQHPAKSLAANVGSTELPQLQVEANSASSTDPSSEGSSKSVVANASYVKSNEGQVQASQQGANWQKQEMQGLSVEFEPQEESSPAHHRYTENKALQNAPTSQQQSQDVYDGAGVHTHNRNTQDPGHGSQRQPVPKQADNFGITLHDERGSNIASDVFNQSGIANQLAGERDAGVTPSQSKASYDDVVSCQSRQTSLSGRSSLSEGSVKEKHLSHPVQHQPQLQFPEQMIPEQKQHPQPDPLQQEPPRQDFPQQQYPRQDVPQQQPMLPQQPPKQDLLQQQPSRQDHLQQQPLRQDFVQQQPLRQDLGQQQPPKQDLLQQQPSRQDLGQQQPARQDLLQQQPLRQDFVQQQPPRQGLVQQQPVQQDRPQQQPLRQDFVQQQPPRQDLVQQQPVQQDLSQQQPLRQDPQQQPLRQDLQQQPLMQDPQQQPTRQDLQLQPLMQDPQQQPTRQDLPQQQPPRQDFPQQQPPRQDFPQQQPLRQDLVQQQPLRQDLQQQPPRQDLPQQHPLRQDLVQQQPLRQDLQQQPPRQDLQQQPPRQDLGQQQPLRQDPQQQPLRQDLGQQQAPRQDFPQQQPPRQDLPQQHPLRQDLVQQQPPRQDLQQQLSRQDLPQQQPLQQGLSQHQVPHQNMQEIPQNDFSQPPQRQQQVLQEANPTQQQVLHHPQAIFPNTTAQFPEMQQHTMPQQGQQVYQQQSNQQQLPPQQPEPQQNFIQQDQNYVGRQQVPQQQGPNQQHQLNQQQYLQQQYPQFPQNQNQFPRQQFPNQQQYPPQMPPGSQQQQPFQQPFGQHPSQGDLNVSMNSSSQYGNISPAVSAQQMPPNFGDPNYMYSGWNSGPQNYNEYYHWYYNMYNNWANMGYGGYSHPFPGQFHSAASWDGRSQSGRSSYASSRNPSEIDVNSRPSSVLENRQMATEDFELQSLEMSKTEISTFQRASPVEMERLTPVHFHRAHTTASFSKLGNCIIVDPNDPKDDQSATVLCVPNKNLYATPELDNFPGPLCRKETSKKSILMFIRCQSNSWHSRTDMSKEYCDSMSLLWDYISMLVKQKGSVDGQDVAELLMQHKPPTDIGHKMDNLEGLPGVATTNKMPKDVAEDHFRECLTQGSRKEALDFAVNHDLWGHALILSYKMDPKVHQAVMNRLVASLNDEDSLLSLYGHLSGRGIPSHATIKAFGRQLKYLAGDRMCHAIRTGNADWREHLAMLIANPTKHPDKDKKNIILIGDSLGEQGNVGGAHLCYLLAGVKLSKYDEKNSKLCLLGVDHKKENSCRIDLWATNEAIQLTEIYEYALRLQSEHAFIPIFQKTKLLYINRLYEVGLLAKAYSYCQLIAEAVLSEPRSYDFRFLKLFSQVCQRLVYLSFETPDDTEPEWYTELLKLVELKERNVEYTDEWGKSSEPSATSSSPTHSPEHAYRETPSQDSQQDALTASSTDLQPGFYTQPSEPVVTQQESEQFNANTAQGYEQQVNHGTAGWTEQDQYGNQADNYGAQAEENYQQWNEHQDNISPPQQMDHTDGAMQQQDYNQEQYQQQQQQWNQNQQIYDQQMHNPNVTQQYNTEQVNQEQDLYSTGYYPDQQNQDPSVAGKESCQQAFPQQSQEEAKEAENFFDFPRKTAKSEARNETSKDSSPVKKEDATSKPKKEDPKHANPGWIRSIFSKVLPIRPKEAYLPDDKNKSIYWDEKLGKFVDKDEPEKTFTPPPPPPTDSQFSSSLASVPPTQKDNFTSLPSTSVAKPSPLMDRRLNASDSNLPSPDNGEQTASPVPSKFSRTAHGIGKRGHRYVNSFSGIHKDTTDAPPAAALFNQIGAPQPAPMNFFVPQAPSSNNEQTEGGTNTEAQPPQPPSHPNQQHQSHGENQPQPPSQQTQQPQQPTFFNPVNMQQNQTFNRNNRSRLQR